LVFGPKTGRGGARRLLERAGEPTSEGRVDRLLTRLRAEGPMGLQEALTLASGR
jgi:hypothetical protein